MRNNFKAVQLFETNANKQPVSSSARNINSGNKSTVNKSICSLKLSLIIQIKAQANQEYHSLRSHIRYSDQHCRNREQYGF